MKLYADYHTHTVYSHGTGNIMDNVIAARKKGLTEIAITDHGIRHFAYGVKLSDIAKMRDEVDRINENAEGIKVLLGMECNIISTDGDIDMDDGIRKYIDILLVGFHMMVLPKTMGDFLKIYGRNYVSKIFHSGTEGIKNINTESMIKAIRKHKIDIITHPGARIPLDTTLIAREAAKAGTALEINSHSSYMRAEHVVAAAREGTRFVIDSDAHSPEDVGNLQNGLDIAIEAGLTSEQIINAVQ
ncbi:MAG TPA: PHP domain-containing protein [Clostridia bacterium]|nr:PHP domain-containing protein [Clostridia bacterium]